MAVKMLYPELFKALERVRWNLDHDVPWADFDTGKLSDEQALTIKMNAITEWAALPATEMFLRDNREDSDFSAFMSVWFFEEQKHALVLIEYLRRFRPDLAPTEEELHAVRFTFDPAPPLETLMMHFCGEIRLNHWYRCAGEWHTEPVIKKIYDLISRDEARHGGAYLRYMKKALEAGGDDVKAAFAKIGLLMASARHLARLAGRLSRPGGVVDLEAEALGIGRALEQAAAPDQPAREPVAVSRRHGAVQVARPRLARALARRTDPLRQDLGNQGCRHDPGQPVEALRPADQDAAGAQPLPARTQNGSGDPGLSC